MTIGGSRGGFIVRPLVPSDWCSPTKPSCPEPQFPLPLGAEPPYPPEYFSVDDNLEIRSDGLRTSATAPVHVHGHERDEPRSLFHLPRAHDDRSTGPPK